MARHWLLRAAAATAALLSGVSAQRTSGDPAFSLTTSDYAIKTTGKFIIELSSDAGRKFRKRDGTIDTESIVAQVEDATGKAAQPALTFDSGIFQGLSVDLQDHDETSSAVIEAIPGVQRAWPAALFTIPTTVQGELELDANGLPLWTPHDMTGVSKAHEAGHFGAGVTVAIVDSGVDFNHPALGGGFGPGFKVEAGYDFVGDEYDPEIGTPAIPGGQPLDCSGHGTHVAGILASSHEYNLGVAPNSTLRAYKVFGCAGRAGEDVIIAGFLRAYEEGADIISASLGSIQGFPSTPSAIVVGRLQAAGVFVCVAAGNSGADGGPFLSSNLANGVDVTAVGSVSHGKLVAYIVKAQSSDGSSRDIAYVPANNDWGLEGEAPAHFYNDTRTREVCDYTSYHTRIPANEVLLLRRGECDWSTMDIPLYGGVSWAFFYNHKDAMMDTPFRMDPLEGAALGFALISYEDGMWLLEQHESGLKVTYNFPSDDKAVSLPDAQSRAGAADYFSSWGPTLDARIKPEISAPGIAALFFSSRGGRAAIGSGAAQLVRERIIASGMPVKSDPLALLPIERAPITKQGAGLVDATKVLDYTTRVSPPVLHLNDTANFVGKHTITVYNDGTADVTYLISHDAGITAVTKDNPSAWVSFIPSDVVGNGTTAHVDFSTESFAVAPGESFSFDVTFTEPSGMDPGLLPVYGGQVVLSGDNGEGLRVTYQGILGSLFDADMWEMDRGVPMYFRKMDPGVGNEDMEDGDEYPLTQTRGGPIIYYVHHWATDELSFDYVAPDWEPSDWVYPPVAGQNKWFGSLRGLDRSFPINFHIRAPGSNQVHVLGTYSNGEKIKEGEYRILGRTLRNYGNPQNMDHWQWKVSPRFSVYNPASPTATATATSSVPSATATSTAGPIPPIATCGVSKPVHIEARVGMTDQIIPVVPYSDFLGVDTTGVQAPLEFALTSEGHLKVRRADRPGVDLFAAAIPQNDSLVYLYPESQITGIWSHLQCEVKCGGSRIGCSSGLKTKLYTCDLELEKHIPLRFTNEIPEGCQRVSLLAESLPQDC